MESHFRIEVSGDGTASVVTLSGELDLASSATLEEELLRVTDAGSPLIIIDLRELEFMDSTGLSVLIKAHQQAESSGRRFALVRGSQQVQRLLSLTGVAERVELGETPEELLDDA